MTMRWNLRHGCVALRRFCDERGRLVTSGRSRVASGLSASRNQGALVRRAAPTRRCSAGFSLLPSGEGGPKGRMRVRAKRGLTRPSSPARCTKQRLSSACGSRVTFLLLVHARAGARANGEAGPKGGGQDARSQREVTKRKRHPAWRLPPIHGRQVRESGSGFSTGLLSGRKGIAIPADARCAACRPRLTAAQGPRVEQRAILARTRCATA